MNVESTTTRLLRLAGATACDLSDEQLRRLHAEAETLMATAILSMIHELTGGPPSALPKEVRGRCLEDVTAQIVGYSPAGLAYLDITSYARSRNVL